MIKAIIIDEGIYINGELSPFNAYRLYFEDDKGERSIDKTYFYTDIEMKKGKIHCGKEAFFDIPNEIVNAQFKFKYGEYFSQFTTVIMNPNKELQKKILDFNHANRSNILRLRYNKELLFVPIFTLNELIKDTDIVFIQEHSNCDYGANFLFFNSLVLNSKEYVINLFNEYGFNVVDNTKNIKT
ncbi:hypothetical protein [Acinetobacter guillouiae]|uniref:hypothetical protein n=1 Tax=Acinetobacter guillouiae TaxID=106649 RepID=UPI0026E31BA7|nr:hypothetical protein [Acinetobacter guillouiae]MDO6645412.1 hypothetical protein [Acinetobacter guillouiae]